MSKGKLRKFEEMKTFPNVLQPAFEEVFHKDYSLKGKWNASFFKNANPVILELGCGKGEYSVGMATRFRNKNFLGVDIKGSRMWKGARYAMQNNLKNVGFLRTRIELIDSFFAQDEVEEIWLTFPDPQLKKGKKRLSSSRFLNTYRRFLKHNGIIHLKTDNEVLFRYTGALVKYNKLEIITETDDLYNSGLDNDILSIKTFYESQFLEQGLNIHYISFHLDGKQEIHEPPGEF